METWVNCGPSAVLAAALLALSGCQQGEAAEPRRVARDVGVDVALGDPSLDLEAEARVLRTGLTDLEARARATDARLAELVREISRLREELGEQRFTRDEADRIERRLSEMETRLGI